MHRLFDNGLCYHPDSPQVPHHLIKQRAHPSDIAHGLKSYPDWNYGPLSIEPQRLQMSYHKDTFSPEDDKHVELPDSQQIGPIVLL